MSLILTNIIVFLYWRMQQTIMNVTHQLSILFVVFNLRPFNRHRNVSKSRIFTKCLNKLRKSNISILFQTKAELFCYSALVQRVGFNQKPLIVLQIKEIKLWYIDLDRSCCQFIGKSISNDGTLELENCKTTQFDFEAFSAQLGDKQVITIWDMFKILLINDNYLETLLNYEDFFNKSTLFGYYKALFVSK